MVRLNRIYTRSGDDGETFLGDGSRVAKSDQRIVAVGTVDELNSLVGIAVAGGASFDELGVDLRLIQNDLFDLGADVAVPEVDEPPPSGERVAERLGVTTERVERLEQWIDAANERLEPLTSFVLPGGSAVAAHLHHARAVCRRAEIAVVALAGSTPQHAVSRRYLNRLSDLLFVLARVANDDGRSDVLWKPGG